jgi:soluble lytic murein transglycosylase
MYPTVYNDYVEKNAAAYGIPPEIIYAVIKTESGFRHDVVSSQGAVGLMQIMPDTFTWLLTKTGEDLGLTELYNPAVNIKYGTYLLSILHDELPAWDNVYAAYNAGIGNARNWLKDSRYTKNGVITNAPLSETSSYIIKVNKAVKMYQKLYF